MIILKNLKVPRDCNIVNLVKSRWDERSKGTPTFTPPPLPHTHTHIHIQTPTYTHTHTHTHTHKLNL